MMDYSTASNIEIITQLIIEEAEGKHRKDIVADIYSTLREVCLSVGRRMNEARGTIKEREAECK